MIETGSPRTLDGTATARAIREEVARGTAELTREHGVVPGLTVVLIGSSQSKLAHLGEGPRMYTPRGYAKRIDKQEIA